VRDLEQQERDPRAVRLLRKRDPSVVHWPEADREHSRTLEEVERVLDRMGARVAIVHRANAAFDTSDAALVVAVGGDGTLLAASHNVAGVPILGVNSAPRYSVGFFCAAARRGLGVTLAKALDGAAAQFVGSCALRDLFGSERLRWHTGHLAQDAVEIDKAAPAQESLVRNTAEACGEAAQDLDFLFVAGGETDVPAFRFQRGDVPVANQQRADAKPGARPENRERAVGLRIDA
jgi:hypothetical protein